MKWSKHETCEINFAILNVTGYNMGHAEEDFNLEKKKRVNKKLTQCFNGEGDVGIGSWGQR